MSDDRRFITTKEALELLPAGDYIHTFRSNGALIGADASRTRIIKILNTWPNSIEISGPIARRMKHGITVKDDVGFLFLQTDMEKLNKFDPE